MCFGTPGLTPSALALPPVMRHYFVRGHTACFAPFASNGFSSFRHATRCTGGSPSLPRMQGLDTPCVRAGPLPPVKGSYSRIHYDRVHLGGSGGGAGIMSVRRPHRRRAPLSHADTMPSLHRPRCGYQHGLAQQGHGHGGPLRALLPPARDGLAPPTLQAPHAACRPRLETSGEVHSHTTAEKVPRVLAQVCAPALRRHAAAWRTIAMRGQVRADGARRHAQAKLA